MRIFRVIPEVRVRYTPEKEQDVVKSVCKPREQYKIPQRLTDQQVKEIKWLCKYSNLSKEAVADMYNLCYSYVCDIAAGRTRRKVTEPKKLDFYLEEGIDQCISVKRLYSPDWNISKE